MLVIIQSALRRALAEYTFIPENIEISCIHPEHSTLFRFFISEGGMGIMRVFFRYCQ